MNLDIYFQYTSLKSKMLAHMLFSLSDIYDVAAALADNNQVDQNPQLEIQYIRTGDSIKLSLVDGWLPKITSDDENDIIIGTPRKLGIPLLIGYLIVSGASELQKIQGQYLENEKSRYEIEIKKLELEELRRKMESSEKIHFQVNDFNKFVRTNEDIVKFSINGVEIRNRN